MADELDEPLKVYQTKELPHRGSSFVSEITEGARSERASARWAHQKPASDRSEEAMADEQDEPLKVYQKTCDPFGSQVFSFDKPKGLEAK